MARDCPHCGQVMPYPHGIILNDDARIALYDGKVSDRMFLRDYEVLQYLVKHFGKFCTLDQIAEWAFGLYDPPDDPRNAISASMWRLRRHLVPLGLAIESVNGSGLGWRLSFATYTKHSIDQDASHIESGASNESAAAVRKPRCP